MIVGVEAKFDAAHRLPNYPGKCKVDHGHTWHVEVEVTGDIKDDGMVVDLAELKMDVNNLVQVLDHNHLNKHFANPTCEVITMWIHDHLVAKYNIQRVKVREGDGGWAQYG